jgi:hypothetical protein
MDVLRVLRFAWVPLSLSACCLDVVPVDTGSSSGFPPGVITSGGGNTGGASTGNLAGGTSVNGGTPGGGSGSGGGSNTGGGCTYPLSASPGWMLFPDVTLGVGWLNLNGAIDSASTIGPEPDLLLQLHCSGERYVLIDISGAWSPHSVGFAEQAPSYTAGWLVEGGLVLTVLEQDATGSGAPATAQTLTSWAAQFQINYSLVNDPPETLVTTLGIAAWPTLYIVRLSDMAIVYSVPGNTGAIIATFDAVLGGAFDGGSQ